MDRRIAKHQELITLRRALINEIHFTHAKAVRLLRAMAPRDRHGLVGHTLHQQLLHDTRAQRALVELGMEMGMPPGPCVCAEAEAVLEGVHHADRLDRTSVDRDRSILEALKALRYFLIRRWSLLLSGIEAIEGRGPLFELVLMLQGEEAEQHRATVRELLALAQEGSEQRRSA